MNLRRLTTIKRVGLAVTLMVTPAYCAWNWSRARQDLTQELDLAAECQLLSRRIQTLQATPTESRVQTSSGESIAQLVELASQDAGLVAERIVHVAPGTPRPVTGSSYLEQATDVELREISIQQLVQFALAIPRVAPGTHIPHLVIRAPQQFDESQQQELWNVQMTLTAHVHPSNIPPSR